MAETDNPVEPSELEKTAQTSSQNSHQPAQHQEEKKKPETPLEEIANAGKNTLAFGIGTAAWSKAEGTSLKNLAKELNPFAYLGGGLLASHPSLPEIQSAESIQGFTM